MYVCVCALLESIRFCLHIRHLKVPPMIIFPGIYMHDCLCQHTIYINMCSAHCAPLCQHTYYIFVDLWSRISHASWVSVTQLISRSHLPRHKSLTQHSRTCFEQFPVPDVLKTRRFPISPMFKGVSFQNSLEAHISLSPVY